MKCKNCKEVELEGSQRKWCSDKCKKQYKYWNNKEYREHKIKMAVENKKKRRRELNEAN